jgi:hypothetical protein
MKKLAQSGRSKKSIEELDKIKKANILDEQEFSCLLNMTLTSAIEAGHAQSALDLLEYGCPPEPYECLALRLAASLGQENVVLECINKGANPTIGGNMVLDLAISHKQTKTITSLLNHFKSNPQRPSAKELFRSASNASINLKENLEVTKTILNLISTKDLQEEIKINGKEKPIDTNILTLAKDVITSRRKKSLDKVIDYKEWINP